MDGKRSPRLGLRAYLARYALLFLGFFAIALGVAMSSRAMLGTTPVSCIPLVLSESRTLSAGTYTILLQSLFLLAQLLILRRDFEWMRLTQMLSFFVFGYFVDLTLYLLRDLHVEGYLQRWLLLGLSFVVIAIGVYLEVRAGVSMLAAEGLTSLIAQRYHFDFGRVKSVFDCSLVAIAFVLSLLLYGELRAVREGTIASAVCIGLIVRQIFKLEAFVKSRLRAGRVGADQSKA